MKNLKRIWSSESKIYSLLGVQIRRGIPQKNLIYIGFTYPLMWGLSTIPVLPFYWLDMVVGDIPAFCINWIILPSLIVSILVNFQRDQAGKSILHKIFSKWIYIRSKKQLSRFRPASKSESFQFGVMTFRENRRKESDKYGS